MLRIAVLMTCFNRREKTLNSLKFLFNQEGLGKQFSLEVFLVDDGSTDGTSLAIKEAYPQINIIQGDGTLYWNRGMHRAWTAASNGSFDAFLWLNDDSFLYKDALLEMLTSAKLTAFKSIICGCMESPIKKGELTYGGGTHHGTKYVSNFPNGNLLPCDIINGNCVLVPNFVFKKVGNLDWQFNHGIGDNDYSLRAKKLGLQSFTARYFIGSCAKNEKLANWCLPEVPLIKRVKNLYSPIGNPPGQYFIFEKRHFGIFAATIHYLSTHLRVLMPKLWH